MDDLRLKRPVALGVIALVCAACMLPTAASATPSAQANLQFRPVLAEFPPATTSSFAPLTNAADVVRSCDPAAVAALDSIPTTNPGDDHPSDCVVLEQRPQSNQATTRLYLGPAAFNGADVKNAKSRNAPGQGNAIDIRFTRAGRRAVNAVARELFEKSPPMNQMAVVLDGLVVTAPAFQQDSFSGDIQVSGSFTAEEAATIARRIDGSRWLSRFCATTTATVPESYVGSDQHVKDLKALEDGAPHRVAAAIAVVRKYTATHVDPADPTSQEYDRWPAKVNAARTRIMEYGREHCR